MLNSNKLLIIIALFVGLTHVSRGSGLENKHLFVIGNSITRHQANHSINWPNDWGMAASSSDSDYVSQLTELLNNTNSSEKWLEKRTETGALETDPAKFIPDPDLIEKARQADLVVIQAGDDFHNKTSTLEQFSSAYLRTAMALHPTKGKLACISTWWGNIKINAIIRENCQAAGGAYVDISQLSRNEENVARSERHIENSGVGAHPGDKGMKAIATLVFEAIKD